MDRIGAGFIAMLAAVLFALFDLTASLLVLLGFLIFRWAVIAAPILGTVGLLRPASAGLRRLANAVVAAVFNIAIFGTGAAIYLFAVDLIMNTPTLPGWLQVVLVWLCGVVGWLLLRPYRRITQLGGKDSSAAIASAGSWHRRFFRDMREAAKLDVAEPGGTDEPQIGKRRRVFAEQTTLRPEARLEDPGSRAAAVGRPRRRSAPRPANVPAARRPAGRGAGPPRRQPARWTEPDVAETAPASYAIYRPDSAPGARSRRRPAAGALRGEVIDVRRVLQLLGRRRCGPGWASRSCSCVVVFGVVGVARAVSGPDDSAHGRCPSRRSQPELDGRAAVGRRRRRRDRAGATAADHAESRRPGSPTDGRRRRSRGVARPTA